MKEGLTRSQVSDHFGKAKDNHSAYQVKDVFADNEAERQRRLLNEENEMLKKRLRAVEAIANSGNIERIKFMEGASWIANKGMQEASKHKTKLEGFKSEFVRRANMCITDPSINEVDGLEFTKLLKWTGEIILEEGKDNLSRFETLMENVNYNLSQAQSTFKKK